MRKKSDVIELRPIGGDEAIDTRRRFLWRAIYTVLAAFIYEDDCYGLTSTSGSMERERRPELS